MRLSLGLAGRFWSLYPAITRLNSADDFRDSMADGFAKAALNCLLIPSSAGITVSTETRVQTFGKTAEEICGLLCSFRADAGRSSLSRLRQK